MNEQPAERPATQVPGLPVPQTPEEALRDAQAGFGEIDSILKQALADDELAAEAARRQAEER